MKEIDLSQLYRAKKIVVLGDFMLDIYTMGGVERISPEAPVLVLKVARETKKPGGAGNAVLNLLSLGMQVLPIGRVGADEGGKEFVHLLRQEALDTSGIFIDETFRTPIKARMIADTQQLLRVDYEAPMPLPIELEEKISRQLPAYFEGASAIAISDYAKGFLTPSLLQRVMEVAANARIPVIVDPKGMDFKRYKGATLLKPNLSEAIAVAGLGTQATLDSVAMKIFSEVEIENLMVTRAKDGIALFHREKTRLDFPAPLHEVKDVTGAGDTVLAVVVATVANALDLSLGAQLANLAAGLAIERVGCARISLAELNGRLVEVTKSDSLRKYIPYVF